MLAIMKNLYKNTDNTYKLYRYITKLVILIKKRRILPLLYRIL